VEVRSIKEAPERKGGRKEGQLRAWGEHSRGEILVAKREPFAKEEARKTPSEG